MKKLKEFLLEQRACQEGYDFAADLTLKEFLETCQRGDWILWLFAKINPTKLRELTLAKGYCANTVRHFMTDERSLRAVDVAIAFGEGKATREELDDVSVSAFAAASATYASASASAAAYAAYASASASASCAATYAAAFAAASAYAKNANRKLTADICRKYLPIEIWNNY
tara:strand:+ start:556 stop:1068 length:513 start_codon:yes stop_codon:yes gene_type:complete